MLTDPENFVSDMHPLCDVKPGILSELKHLDFSGRVNISDARVVSAGAYGNIYKGCYKSEDEAKFNVAIKQLRICSNEDITLLFEKEIYIWSKLRHPNILALLGYSFDRSTGFPMFISAWMDNGSVWSYLKSDTPRDVLHLVQGVAEGLGYLHEKGVIHSDIKADNVLVTCSGDAVICDFGVSRMAVASRTLGQLTSNLKGTSRYLAYELLVLADEWKNSEKSDVWAFGMTVYEILTRKHPYANCRHDGQVAMAIMKRELPSLPSDFDAQTWPGPDVKRLLWDICQDCWDHDPLKRSTMSAILRKLRAVEYVQLPSLHEDFRTNHQNLKDAKIRSYTFSSSGSISGSPLTDSFEPANPNRPQSHSWNGQPPKTEHISQESDSGGVDEVDLSGHDSLVPREEHHPSIFSSNDSNRQSHASMKVSLKDIPTLGNLYANGRLSTLSDDRPKYKPVYAYLDCISLYQGDITKLEIDAIVHERDETSQDPIGTGNISDTIHSAAGPELAKESRRFKLNFGDAAMTSGYGLPAKHVIHVRGPGPIYAIQSTIANVSQLGMCYKRSLELATRNSLKTIALPSISTQNGEFPIEDATRIALEETRRFLDLQRFSRALWLRRIIFVFSCDEHREEYEKLIPSIFPAPRIGGD